MRPAVDFFVVSWDEQIGYPILEHDGCLMYEVPCPVASISCV